MYTEDIVSVIAPAYNHEKYIIDSLKSIAQQTYYNKQLIVIDDCSSDKTVELIEKFINNEIVRELFPAGIRFVKHEKNLNAHRTINEGINMAIGKYISIINTDDCYEKERLSLMIDMLKNERARIAFSKVRCIDENGQYISHELFELMETNIYKYPTPSFALTMQNVAIGTGNFVLEKSLFEEVGGFSENYHFIHDWDFILKASLISEPVYVKDTCYLYRFHSTNTIKQIDENRENELKKDSEVKMVLLDFLKAIRNRKIENPIFDDILVWDYFFEQNPDQYCSFLWKQLKEANYGI